MLVFGDVEKVHQERQKYLKLKGFNILLFFSILVYILSV